MLKGTSVQKVVRHLITICPPEGQSRRHFTMFYQMERNCRKHITTFCPLEEHPGRRFIMSYLPKERPRGHFHCVLWHPPVMRTIAAIRVLEIGNQRSGQQLILKQLINKSTL